MRILVSSGRTSALVAAALAAIAHITNVSEAVAVPSIEVPSMVEYEGHTEPLLQTVKLMQREQKPYLPLIKAWRC